MQPLNIDECMEFLSRELKTKQKQEEELKALRLEIFNLNNQLTEAKQEAEKWKGIAFNSK